MSELQLTSRPAGNLAPTASRQPSPPVFYRPELDALRFMAFGAVFVTHTMPTEVTFYQSLHIPEAAAHICANAARAGMGGVVLFFMLSSYLITSLIIREHHRTGTLALTAFYKRRALRIWPLYFVFLAACLAFGPTIAPHHVAGFATFTENWVIYFTEGPLTPATPLWSVSVEEQFYLVWPLLIAAAGLKRLPLVVGGCIAAAVFARWLMVAHGANDSQLWQATFSHVDSIAVGALLAYFHRHGLPAIPSRQRIAWLILGLATIVGARFLDSELWRYPAVTLGCAQILVAVTGYQLPAGKLMQAMVYLGKISFGLYVFHVAFVRFFDHLLPKVAFVVPASLLCTVATAALSYRWLELPFLKLKQKYAVVKSHPVK